MILLQHCCVTLKMHVTIFKNKKEHNNNNSKNINPFKDNYVNYNDLFALIHLNHKQLACYLKFRH